MQFAIEPIAELTNEAELLFLDHWKECGFGSFSSDVKFTVQEGMEQAAAMEATGNHVSVVARIDGDIVGYLLGTIQNLIHHNEPMFQAHSLYIVPSIRSTGAGKELIAASESLLYHERGVRLFCQASNTNKPIGKFLESIGYEATDVIYTKRFRGVG